MTPRSDPPIRTRPLRSDDWPLVASLFGDNGACGGCWCMWWRVPKGGKSWEEAKGARNRDRLRRLVEAGEVHAVIALSGTQPVGWCSVGPRESFPRLDTVRALRHEVAPGTWSVVCFFIPARWRGKGVATTLLAAATKLAVARGARVVEGYPVVPRGERMPAAFAWTGVPALFDGAGYRELRREGASRPIYRKSGVGRSSRPAGGK